MKMSLMPALADEELSRARLWRDTLPASVEFSRVPAPHHPELAQRQLDCDLRVQQRRDVRFAACSYVLLATAFAVLPGVIFHPAPLVCFAVAATLVATAMIRGWLGGVSAMCVQGTLSTALLLCFGLGGVFTGFMLLGQLLLPAAFDLWIEAVETARD